MNKNQICQRPFSEIEIHTDGKVYTCCPSYQRFYCIGNIFEANSFDEIWYSEAAKELRRNLINNNYKYCDTQICNPKLGTENIEYTETPPYPKQVRLGYDCHCNLKCVFCRDKIKINTPEENEKYDSLIETVLIPTLKNANLLSITSTGEITASKHSIKLIERATEVYPNLEFELLTNGLLFNEKFYNSLNFRNKIRTIIVSLHAIKKHTYESIVRGSKYEIVHKNLQYIFDLKERGKIKDVCLIFVVFSKNYKELPEFIDFALKNNASPGIWEYRSYNRTTMDSNPLKYEVWNKSHPEYNNFVKVIKEIQNKYPNKFSMPKLFKDLEPIPEIEIFKNRIKSLFNIY